MTRDDAGALHHTPTFTKRNLLLLAACCLVAATIILIGSPAEARFKLPFKILTYNVVYKGSGTYSVTQDDPPAHSQTSARFHWAVHYHLVIIDRGGEQVAAVTGPLSVGDGTWSISSDNGGGERCSKSGGLKLNKNGVISGRVQPSGKITLQLTPGSNDYKTTGGSHGSGACDVADYWHSWVESFSKVGTGDTGEVDPLTAFVTLKRQELRFGKLIVNVSSHTLAAPELTVNEDCGSGNGASCRQAFDWKGSVTFRKLKIRRGR